MNGITLLKCICDETRFGILEILQQEKELCVNDFVEKLKKDQPLISHHLKTLKKCGILQSREEGNKVMYSVPNKQLSKLIKNIVYESQKIPVLCKDNACC
jgi:DNA-binding transcriptional ArsR family regulator